MRGFEGLVRRGEMLVVQGRPGRRVMLWTNREKFADTRSGCSTLLTTISRETDRLNVAGDS